MFKLEVDAKRMNDNDEDDKDDDDTDDIDGDIDDEAYNIDNDIGLR